MENQINVSNQSNQQTVRNPVVQPPSTTEKSKVNYLTVGLTVLVCSVIFGFGGYYLGKQSSNAQSIPTATPASNPTSNWKAYSLKTIGLEFKLSSAFNSYGELKEEIKPGEKGTQLCMTFAKKTSFLLVKPVFAGSSFCSINYFGLGTVSTDYEAGREGGFTDLLGFTIEDGKYYARQNLSRKFEIPASLVEVVKNQYDVQVIKIVGKNSTTGEWQGPIAGTPGDGRMGALVNTSNDTYPGIAIEMELGGNLTEEVFDKILSTLKYSD